MRLAICLLIGAVLAIPAHAVGSTSRADMEARLVELVNSERADRGLDPLAPHDGLTDAARVHARRMVEQRRMFHSDHLGYQANCHVRTRWRTVSENVGYAPSGDVGRLHDAFMDSDSHRRNVLREGADAIGVGVDTTADGTIYVTALFVTRR